MIINIHGIGSTNKVFYHLMMNQMREFTKEYQLHTNYGEDIMRSEKGRALFCEWLKEKEILNAKPWILETNDRVIGAGIKVEEDGLLTRFLLECE